jgi:hypothetical protein
MQIEALEQPIGTMAGKAGHVGSWFSQATRCGRPFTHMHSRPPVRVAPQSNISERESKPPSFGNYREKPHLDLDTL